MEIVNDKGRNVNKEWKMLAEDNGSVKTISFDAKIRMDRCRLLDKM